MNKSKLSFYHTLRVRYAEIDAQAIVFNAHYLTYFDTTLTELFRSLGITFGAQNMNKLEFDYHLVKSVVEYHAPVYYDEVIEIYVGVARIGNSSLTFKLYIYSEGDDKLRTSGEIIWVYANRHTEKSAPLPQDVIDKLQPYVIESTS